MNKTRSSVLYSFENLGVSVIQMLAHKSSLFSHSFNEKIPNKDK